MRLYFLSCVPAGLKLNGLYAGGCDLFERHIEVDLNDGVLAEIVPGGNLQPVNFFIDGALLSDPPDFCDVYLCEDEAVIYIKNYVSKNSGPEVIFQTRFMGNLITVFKQGQTYLSCEGAEYSLTPLGIIDGVTAEEKSLCGFPVLTLRHNDTLIIISAEGKLIYFNQAARAQFGDELICTMQLETCTHAYAECTYTYDGKKLNLTKAETHESLPPDEKIMHFAFFESVLIRADFEKYLSPALKQKAGDLREYLGEFTGVTIPTQSFYERHKGACAAGLVYPKKRNLYAVKYYAVDYEDGKIDNIYPL